MPAVHLTEDEAELAILALEEFKRHSLGEYDSESRAEIAEQLRSAIAKLRDA